MLVELPVGSRDDHLVGPEEAEDVAAGHLNLTGLQMFDDLYEGYHLELLFLKLKVFLQEISLVYANF